MTKERVCANDTSTSETEAPERVGKFENAELHGYPLCHEVIWEKALENIQSLRTQQAAYEASLPKEPEAIVTAIKRIVFENELDDPLEEALSLSVLMHEGIGGRDFDIGTNPHDPLKRAFTHVAAMIEYRLRTAEDQRRRVRDILVRRSQGKQTPLDSQKNYR